MTDVVAAKKNADLLRKLQHKLRKQRQDLQRSHQFDVAQQLKDQEQRHQQQLEAFKKSSKSQVEHHHSEHESALETLRFVVCSTKYQQ